MCIFVCYSLFPLPPSPLSLPLSPWRYRGRQRERERELSFACVMKVNLPSDRWTNLAPKRKKCLNRVGGGPVGAGVEVTTGPTHTCPQPRLAGAWYPGGGTRQKLG